MDNLSEAAQLLGRRGGLKGGTARAEALTAARRHEIAVQAAQARWGVVTTEAQGAEPAKPLMDLHVQVLQQVRE